MIKSVFYNKACYSPVVPKFNMSSKLRKFTMWKTILIKANQLDNEMSQSADTFSKWKMCSRCLAYMPSVNNVSLKE